MSPLTQADLHSGKVRAQATDLLSGKTEQLTTIPRSACHFFEPFACGGFRVLLRLDWKDLDGNQNPTLDADFYDLVTAEMVKSMRANEAHHTPARGDGERAYDWEFADEAKRLRVSLIWTVSLSAVAKATAAISMQIIRAREGRS